MQHFVDDIDDGCECNDVHVTHKCLLEFKFIVRIRDRGTVRKLESYLFGEQHSHLRADS